MKEQMESSHHYPHDHRWAIDWALVEDLPTVSGNLEWRVWEANVPVEGQLQTVVAAFWHIPTQKLWIDPVICGGEKALESAVRTKVGIILDGGPAGVFLAVPADWIQEESPENSRWVGMLEERFREEYG